MAEVEGGRGEEILDFGFWMKRAEETRRRNAEDFRGRETRMSEDRCFGCLWLGGRWDEEQARDAAATGILDFG